MIKLDKTKVYDLSELTNEECTKLINYLKNNYGNWKNCIKIYNGYTLYFDKGDGTWYQGDTKPSTTNAKELFYTLENVQVDCRGLTQQQIDRMKEVVIQKGYTLWNYKTAFQLNGDVHYLIKNETDNDFLLSTFSKNKTTITYDKFMELFSDKVEFNPQPHYNNENGSLYKIANDLGLNHWEFDIFKRLVRCRKKNQFKEDLQKIKDTIDIYLNEYSE